MTTTQQVWSAIWLLGPRHVNVNAAPFPGDGLPLLRLRLDWYRGYRGSSTSNFIRTSCGRPEDAPKKKKVPFLSWSLLCTGPLRVGALEVRRIVNREPPRAPETMGLPRGLHSKKGHSYAGSFGCLQAKRRLPAGQPSTPGRTPCPAGTLVNPAITYCPRSRHKVLWSRQRLAISRWRRRRTAYCPWGRSKQTAGALHPLPRRRARGSSRARRV